MVGWKGIHAIAGSCKESDGTLRICFPPAEPAEVEGRSRLRSLANSRQATVRNIIPSNKSASEASEKIEGLELLASKKHKASLARADDMSVISPLFGVS